MMEVKVYDQEGKVVGKEKLEPKIFEIPLNKVLVHQAVVTQQANARPVIAHTKGRGEVSGGGIKPWRQKGTGRARHGSIRSPIWKGGGVTFGPTKERNFKKKINKKAKRKALFMVLSDKARDKKIVVLEDLKIKEYKTKLIEKILDKLPSKGKNVLIILPKSEKMIIKSTNNLPMAGTILADSLNVLDLLKYDFLIFLKDSLKKISEVYLKS